MSQGNTACKSTSLDWYTSTVGETPCQTYQRLRKICNAGYSVGSLSTFTPGDRCDDQVASCCCNSVSFALSMLCLNCQQGVGSGINGDTGYDAGVGAYQIYLGTCNPKTNQGLPNDIQAAVCNEKIKIDDDLYGLFWSDGSWYYMYTRETIQKNQQAKANNVYTHCSSTTINNNTSTDTTLSASATPATPATSIVAPDTHTPTASNAPTTMINNSTSTISNTTATTTINNIGIGTNTAPGSSTRLITASTSTSTAGNVPIIVTNKTSPLTAGTISGIAVGGIAAAVLFVGFVFWLLRRRRRRKALQPHHVSGPEMQLIVEPFTSGKFPSDGTSAASTSHPLLGLPDNNNHLLASSRSTKRRQAQAVVESRPEIDNSLLTTHIPAGAASVSLPANVSPPSTPSQLLSEEPERHIDGGPLLERSPSGRLPPAYGEQFVNT